MKTENILILVLGIVWWISIYRSIRSSINKDKKINDKKYEPINTGYLLPVALFIGFLIDLCVDGIENSVFTLINNCVNLVVVISVYYLFVFLFLKSFRKHLHPIVISSIWMLPNLLYFFVLYRNSFTYRNGYELVIEISSLLMYVFVSVWIVGFILILAYKVIEHFQYRKSILEDAKEITDENILNLFKLEKEKITYNKEIQLMESKHIKTPLTIGVRNKVLVLPNVNYTEEELRLIFKHEIIHIGRSDVIIKLHLVFCNALCWFNPLMWLANKKCSEDLELSCDTSVLANEEDVLRKQYARLILKNANCEKGFTTCLSADAKSLQYRLQSIIHPKNKKTGGIIILVLVFLLIAGWGNVSVAIKGYEGYEELFQSKSVKLTEIRPINVEFKNQVYSFENDEKILEYFSNLELSKLPRMKIVKEDSERCAWFYFKYDDTLIRVMVYDHYLEVDTDYVDAGNQYYYVDKGIDWAYLDELMIEFPSVKVIPLLDGVDLGHNIWPLLNQVSVDGEIIYKNRSVYYDDFYQFYPTELMIEFYDEVVSDIEISEQTVDGNTTYKFDKDETPFVKVTNQSATYIIKTTVKKENTIYDVEYRFDLNN